MDFDFSSVPSVLKIYADDEWKTIMIDFTMGNSELEHHPESLDIDVWSGNSNALSLSGIPQFKEYRTDMGAYQTPLAVDGGTF